MAGDLYSIGLSGVLASSAQIVTTGQNTANVNTEGYNRQTTSLSTQQNGGVEVGSTKRVVDEFVNTQLRSDTSNYNYFDSYYQQGAIADEIFSDKATSLNTYLNNAFDSLQSVNSDPTNTGTRKIAYTDLKNLVSHFNELASFSQDQTSLVNEQLTSNIDIINEYANQIADLNGKILVQETVGGSKANELRDTQEDIARQISEYLDIKISFDENDLMELQLGGGQPLVLQTSVNKLSLSPSEYDSTTYELVLDFEDYELGIDTTDLGGSIGGLMNYRADFLEELDRQLGQQAIVISDSVNQQNRLGLDANGDYGKRIFDLADITVSQSGKNSSLIHEVDVRVEEGKASELSTDTYELIMTSNNAFELRSFGVSGESTAPARFFDLDQMEKTPDGYFSIPGIGIELRLQEDVKVGFRPGDTFQFAPTSLAAANISLASTSGDDLAMNAPIQVERSADNLSDAKISISSVSNTDADTSAFSADGDLYRFAPQGIRFTSESSFDVLDQDGLILAQVADAKNYTDLLAQAGLDESGYDVSLSSKPTAGDVFNISFNQSGRHDNYNGRAIADLQNKALVGGSQSFADAYTSTVARVGNLTNTAKTNMESSEVMMEQSIARRDEVSAVSLDEEAVNLIRYQNSYAASSQVISAAEKSFQTLLNSIR
ncbi:MAG: flagellar hook-associated protein FlgK [Marinomonas sp.]